MKARYYQDMYCSKETEGDVESIAGWDDGKCESNKEYSGYNLWYCSKDGVTEMIYRDRKCQNKLSWSKYDWNGCYPSHDGKYWLKYTKN